MKKKTSAFARFKNRIRGNTKSTGIVSSSKGTVSFAGAPAELGLLKKLEEAITEEELIYLKEKPDVTQEEMAILADHIDYVLGIVDGPSFYSEMERKSRAERIYDNILWRRQYGFYNSAYNEYGLDVVGFRNPDDYYERYVFKKWKDRRHHGKTDPARHQMMSINKLWFYSYMETIKPGLTPGVALAFDRGKVSIPYDTYSTIEEGLLSLNDGVYACKMLNGQMGKGFFKIEKSGRELVFNGGKDTIESFKDSLSKGSYVLQDFIDQHAAICALAPNSVNTVRIATVRTKQDAHVFYALLRMSSRADATLDNASQGGTFVGIDLETGRLRKYGSYYYEYHHDTNHPVSGVKYEGYQIPYWNEITQMVVDLHQYFRGFLVLGWDIALTENGPVVVEINSSPCSKMAQMANGGLKEKWERLRAEK